MTYTLQDILNSILTAVQDILGNVASAIADNANVIATLVVLGGLTAACVKYGRGVLGNLWGWFRSIV